jgi:hypothetical protein
MDWSPPVSGAYPNTVQLRRKGGKEDKEAVPMAYLSHETSPERTCLMRLTILENGWDDKVCHQIDMGMLQEVIPLSFIEELLET